MGKLLYLFRYLKARWAEPSTHAALCSVMLMLGVKVPEGTVNDIITVLGVVFGALGVFFKESAPETKVL